MAPELFTGDESRTTKAADCYALSISIFELGTGCKPFAANQHPVDLIKAIEDHKRPDRPNRFRILSLEATTYLWELIETMWAADPEERPHITVIENRLHRLRDDGSLLEEEVRDIVSKITPNFTI